MENPPHVVWTSPSEGTVLPVGSVAIRGTLERDKRGRVVLPPWDYINARDASLPYTDAELDELLAVVKQRKRRWRIWSAIKLSSLATLILLTYVILPYMAFQFGILR